MELIVDSPVRSSLINNMRKIGSVSMLSGILNLYPLNQSVYEWAVTNKYFTPKSSKESSPEFIQKFSSASQEHFYYENDWNYSARGGRFIGCSHQQG